MDEAQQNVKPVRVAVDVIDDEVPREVFPDGSYDASGKGHFAAVDRAAQAFVGRTLGGEGDEGEEGRRWAGKAAGAIEGAMYELGRALAVVESLRAKEGRLLEMKRVGGKNGVGSQGGRKDGNGAMLMGKRRSLKRAAALLEERAGMLRGWVKEDDAFCDALRSLRKKGGGMRRDRQGSPLIEVGDGEFARIRNIGAPHYLSVSMLNPMVLRFGIAGVAEDCHPHAALCSTRTKSHDSPDAEKILNGAEKSSKMSQNSFNTVLCRLRASRLSAFLRKSFEKFVGEVSGSDSLISSTANSIAVDCGPNHVFYMDRMSYTDKDDSGKAKSEMSKYIDRSVQDSSLIQTNLMELSLAQLRGGKETIAVHRSILDTIESLISVRTLETILDHSAEIHRIRVDWDRGPDAMTERRARIWASSGDGCGPSRLIARVEPVSRANCGDYAHKSGNVRITPAFGVITPAPDDAGTRARPSIPAFQLFSASPSSLSKIDGLDDVPRTYLCPLVGGEINSVICLLMCIRLLDALESAARCDVPEILDVDRHGFAVVVSPLKRNREIRARVWPRGGIAGQEVPSVVVSVDGKRIEEFPETGHGKLSVWRKIIKTVLEEDAKVDVTDIYNEGGNDTQLPHLNGTMQPENLVNPTTPMRHLVQNGPI